MKKTWMLFPAVLLIIFAAISYLNNLTTEEVTEEFTDSESYDVFEETGRPKVVFVYSDPTEHHPQG